MLVFHRLVFLARRYYLVFNVVACARNLLAHGMALESCSFLLHLPQVFLEVSVTQIQLIWSLFLVSTRCSLTYPQFSVLIHNKIPK